MCASSSKIFYINFFQPDLTIIKITTYVTHSHEMSLNLKSGNLRYLPASNLQVPLVILILKSCFYSKKCGCDVFLKAACVAEAILKKSALKFSLCIE